MSRRRSTGDLVPKDITEILAREARVQRGQKKSGSSFGNAFSWLKGSRKKKSICNGLNRTTVGVTEAKLGQKNQEPAKAGPKGNDDQKRLTVHYKTSQHYQENVFIEGSRPQYLEDLHTEAQEGLKILQQEEHNNGVNFADNESIASTDTLLPEQDISSKDEGCSPEARSTTESTETTVTSAVSTRPVLTRQGSTFKPLNPVKRLDRSKKRSRRTTIMGIPNQVQKELAFHRTSTFQQLVSTQPLIPDGEISHSGVIFIPTVDGETPVHKKEGARVHLSELEAASRDEQLLTKHLQAMNQVEQPFNPQGFSSYLGPASTLRPKSLAVPGMTTSFTFSSSTMLSFLQEPQGPVMSISPQATYLSTIIPNAVLPASIEVIKIDRSCSQTRGSSLNHGSSVCQTVSKSSLTSGDSSVSPLLSKRSDGDGSQMDSFHNNSMIMPTSTSVTNCSESQSSKTITSHSSPISSKGSTRSNKSQREGLNGQSEQSGEEHDLVSLRSSVSMSSSKSGNVFTVQECDSAISGSVTPGEDLKTKQNFTRSLSVMKTKQPPAPPRRTNSLHCNKIGSKSRVLADGKALNESITGEMTHKTENDGAKDETSSVHSIKPISLNTSNSPLSVTQAPSNEEGGATGPQPECTSLSAQKTPSEGAKFERTMSPSSGYSSQSGTPTLSPKGISPTSPEKQMKKPVKPDRSVSRASSSAAASPSSSLTSLSSGTSESVNQDVSRSSLSNQGSTSTVVPQELTPNNRSSNLREEIKELLNIPPPPKVRAPCPPPPETWVHNKHSFELLCRPCPDVKAAKTEDCLKQAGPQPAASNEMQVLVPKQSNIDKSVLELTEGETKPGILLEPSPGSVKNELENRECPVIQREKTEASADIQKQEQGSRTAVKPPEGQETTPKKEPPPVMKKPMPSVDRQQGKLSISGTREAEISVENPVTSSQDGGPDVADKNENDKDVMQVTLMHMLSVEVPRISKVSPPPTPPPAYHPTPPLSRKTPTSSISMPPDELERVQEEVHVIESCWPPPPPPMEGDSVFDGGNDVDFPPPPPPPFVAETKEIDSGITELNLSTRPTEDAQGIIVDTVDTGASDLVESPDLPPAVQQTVTDTKLEVDMRVSQNNACDELFCSTGQDILSFSDSVQTPSVEELSLSSFTKIENAVPVYPTVPSSSFLIQDTQKMEGHAPSEPPTHLPITIPVPPPIPADHVAPGVNFRRQPSVANRDTRNKELLSRHKSAPIPKEDANIPLVTPSLLQMVRLRSVNMTEDQVKAPLENKTSNQEDVALENCPVLIPGPPIIPQKPIRKSLSLKSPPHTVKAPSVILNTPSMRLQEAIRMKTAAMSSRDSLPTRLGVRTPPHSLISEQVALSLKSPDICDTHKTSASTASFIFSRSTKKVVIETAAASSPDAQASLKQNLAAELMQMSDQSKAAASSNGGIKVDKVPPPVAKKPAHGSISPSKSLPSCSAKTDFSVGGNGAMGVRNVSGIIQLETTTTRVTADTIETLF